MANNNERRSQKKNQKNNLERNKQKSDWFKLHGETKFLKELKFKIFKIILLQIKSELQNEQVFFSFSREVL